MRVQTPESESASQAARVRRARWAVGVVCGSLLLLNRSLLAKADEPALVSPSLGRPAFVEPGHEFALVATIPTAAGTPEFALTRRSPALRFPLRGPADAAARFAQGDPQSLPVPADVPPGTYDLEIRLGSTTLRGRHCVAVGPIGDTIRIVHLSNMNIGDVSAPRADERLIDEINLLAPTLIVGTGDYLDNTHPDPERGWREFVDFATRFNAPLLLACGDHEDMTQYGRHVAPGAIGVVNIGPHRGIVLFDVPAHPIDEDADQLAWARQTLLEQPPAGAFFAVSHDESPNLLRRLLADGGLQKAVTHARLAAWFVGGQRDWDGDEFRDLIAAAAPLVYIRTQQSSTSARGGADGLSHYHVVDLSAKGVRFLGNPANPRGPQAVSTAAALPSIGVGRLSVGRSGPNDGSAARVDLGVVNGLPFVVNRAAAVLFVRRSGDQQPWCQGAKLVSAVAAGSVWACRVEFDLPDFGARQIAVGSGSAPAEPAAAADFDLPPRLEFRQQRTGDGVEFHSLADDQTTATIWVSNRGPADSVLTPLVRLDGNPLAYQPADGGSPFAIAHRLRLKPGERVALRVDLSAVRVRAGRRTVQVYWKGEPLWPPVWYPLEVVVRP